MIELSRRYGGDPAYVVAGGGNTSRKSSDSLWVKASGHALATIDEAGFVELDRKQLAAMLAGDWPSDSAEREALFLQRVMAARLHPELGQRPSVEALLHHLIPNQLVVHTHPSLVNAVTCCVRGEELTRQWFGDDVLWQPYVDPGLVLAQALSESLAAYRAKHRREPLAIFLQNHGLIIAGESVKEVNDASDAIVRIIAHELTSLPMESVSAAHSLPQLAAVIHAERPGFTTSMSSANGLKWMACTPQGKAAVSAGPLTPDQIVYCRSQPLWLEPGDDASLRRQFVEGCAAYTADHGFEPWVAVLRGSGVVTFRDAAKLSTASLEMFADAAAVYRDATRLGGAQPLSAAHRQFIEQWEVEAYRRSIAAKAGK